MANNFRRPAQITDAQLEDISARQSIPEDSELAHVTAQALFPTRSVWAPDDPAVRDRILELIRTEGVDPVAESWANSPENSLPGIFWRGYLLREWIRRFPEDVAGRLHSAATVLREQGAAGVARIEKTPEPDAMRAVWDRILAGIFQDSLAEVLAASAYFTQTIGEVNPAWIGSPSHPLATRVTRRDRAMLATSKEFREAAELARKGALQ